MCPDWLAVINCCFYTKLDRVKHLFFFFFNSQELFIMQCSFLEGVHHISSDIDRTYSAHFYFCLLPKC